MGDEGVKFPFVPCSRLGFRKKFDRRSRPDPQIELQPHFQERVYMPSWLRRLFVWVNARIERILDWDDLIEMSKGKRRNMRAMVSSLNRGGRENFNAYNEDFNKFTHEEHRRGDLEIHYMVMVVEVSYKELFEFRYLDHLARTAATKGDKAAVEWLATRVCGCIPELKGDCRLMEFHYDIFSQTIKATLYSKSLNRLNNPAPGMATNFRKIELKHGLPVEGGAK